jgi:hypothetical protein
MKVRQRSRSNGKSGRTLPSNTYTLSSAKTYLGRLVEKAKKGETVYILRGHERFMLQAVPEIEPIPMRPVGYFQFDEEDIEQFNSFANASVIPDPKSE